MLLAEMRKFSAGAAKCLYFHTSFFFYHQRKKLVFLFSFCPIPKLSKINRESHFESTAYRYQARYNYCIAGTIFLAVKIFRFMEHRAPELQKLTITLAIQLEVNRTLAATLFKGMVKI